MNEWCSDYIFFFSASFAVSPFLPLLLAKCELRLKFPNLKNEDVIMYCVEGCR
jgi:hypothetical protein